MFFVNNVMFF